MKRNLILLALIIIGITAAIYLGIKNRQSLLPQQPAQTDQTQTPTQATPTYDIIAPLDNAQSRISKKPFGIYVSPGHSPVTPERFTGYHTGTDFETTAEEQTTDVSVSAICTGKILRKETARGYGGMVVQACTYHGDPITVVYGHIRLTSMVQKIGDTLNQGDQFVVLGKPYSSETGGERKHLHLGIHKTATVDTRGYVSDSSLLLNWYDYQQIVNK